MAKLDLTPTQRSALRASAHALRPVVLIGDRGLSDAVLGEIDASLKAHELIKVRIAGEDRAGREALLDTICDTLSCAAVHHLGRMLVLYRPQDAAPDDLPKTRALRKPSEPYVPKKQAAEGATRPAARPAARRGRPAAQRDTPPSRNAATSPRPASAGRGAGAASSRRAGSALTLRAGMRTASRTPRRHK